MSVLIRDSSGQIRPIYLCLRCHSFTPTATCHRCGSDDTAVVVWTSAPPRWALRSSGFADAWRCNYGETAHAA